jgi:hypothetical protein
MEFIVDRKSDFRRKTIGYLQKMDISIELMKNQLKLKKQNIY